MNTDVKRCTKCNLEKPTTEFHKQSNSPDGLAPHCKTCRAIDARIRYEKNGNKQKAQQRDAYAKNPKKKIAKTREWQLAHPEEMKAIQKRHIEKYPDRPKERTRKSNQKHRDKRRDYDRMYREKHPQHNKVKVSRRQAIRKQLPDNFTVADWQRALDYFHGCCAVCGRPAGFWHTIAADHWIPLNNPNCTGTIPSNIVPLCHGIGGCNNSKNDKLPSDWLIETYGKRKATKIQEFIENYLSKQIT